MLFHQSCRYPVGICSNQCIRGGPNRPELMVLKGRNAQQFVVNEHHYSSLVYMIEGTSVCC